LFYLEGSGKATIDWRDGMAAETHKIGNNSRFSHEYSGTATHSITIIGTNIIRLECSGLRNQLSSLDVSKNAELTYLDCHFNQLTSLDVSKNTALTYLACYFNQLKSLDVSKNTALTNLNCGSNKLTDLDVSSNTALTTLNCAGNRLTGSALDALFETLHSNDGDKIIYIKNNPGTDNCDRSIATNKGWTVNDTDFTTVE
jgi:Leucine-rich repeat (LRR) protein